MAEKEELARRLSAAVSRAISEALSQVEVRRQRVKRDYLGFLSGALSSLVRSRLIAIPMHANMKVVCYFLFAESFCFSCTSSGV